MSIAWDRGSGLGIHILLLDLKVGESALIESLFYIDGKSLRMITVLSTK
jgi:hypothetical protein